METNRFCARPLPKYDGDLQRPNVLAPLDQKVCREEVSPICRCCQPQANKQGFYEDLFHGLMRIRGIECASQAK